MITIINDYDGTSVDVRRKELYGLHDDTKPTDVSNGSMYLEMDTGKVFVFDEANTTWIEL